MEQKKLNHQDDFIPINQQEAFSKNDFNELNLNSIFEDHEIDKKTKNDDSKSKSYDSIESYIKEVSQYHLLSFQEEKELSKKIQQADMDALNHLVQSNLRLVIKIAKSFLSREYPFSDLIQDGNIGLIRAAQKYDYRHNVRFSTYAAPWIKQMIIRAISQKKRIVRLPYRKEMLLKKIKDISNYLTKIKKRTPNDDEIVKEMGMSLDEVHKIKTYDIASYSLDGYLSQSNNSKLTSVLQSDSYDPYNILKKNDTLKHTRKILENLFPKERLLIIYRFGLDNNKKHTLKQIGTELGISTETVRQLEERILKKLQKMLTQDQ